MAPTESLADECQRLRAECSQYALTSYVYSNYLLIFCRALTEEHNVVLELHVLRENVRKWRRDSKKLNKSGFDTRDVKKLLRKGKKLAQSSLDTKIAATRALDAYAGVSCRKLCDGVYRAFPRELRDMVLGHLYPFQKLRILRGWEPDTIELDAGWDAHGNNNGWPETSVSTNHLWLSEFVREYPLQEMREYYFYSNLFLFRDDFDLLPRFLTTNQWKLGFRPADTVAHVGLEIDCGNYDFDGLEPVRGYNNNWGGAIDGRRKPRDDCHVLLSGLEQLFGFATGTRMVLEFFVTEATPSRSNVGYAALSSPLLSQVSKDLYLQDTRYELSSEGRPGTKTLSQRRTISSVASRSRTTQSSLALRW
jgi:hypothetical protein